MKRLHLILGAVLMVSAAVLTACSSDDIVTVAPSQETTYPTDAWHVKIIAGKGSQSLTRALAEGSDVNGEAGILATWSSGDEVSVWKGDTKIGTLTATPQDDAHLATLEGTITGDFSTGDKLTLTYIMPDSKYRTYNGQDGTLARLAQYFDYALADVTVNTVAAAQEEGGLGALTTSNATFQNQQAIARLTCKQNGTPLNVAWLTISSASGMIGGADNGSLTIVPKTPSDRIFFAMTNQLSTADIYYFYIKTSDGNYYYAKTATGADGLPTASATIDDGNFYPVEINSWTEYTPTNPKPTPTPPSGDPRINCIDCPPPSIPDTIPSPPPPINDPKYWPLVTQDNHLVLFGKEAVAHNYGPVVGLLVAHDGGGGLVMSIQEDSQQYKWGTQTEWCESHIGGGNGLEMGNAYGTQRTETRTTHALDTYVQVGGGHLYDAYAKYSPYNEKYYLNDWTMVQGNGETNTQNLVSCTGEYIIWTFATIEARQGNSAYSEYLGTEEHKTHNHPAAEAAQNGGGVSAPSASGGWFLPSAQDWLKACKGIGYSHDEFYHDYDDYIISDSLFRDNVNRHLQHADPYPYFPLTGYYYQYWTSTESAPGNAMLFAPARFVNNSGSLNPRNPGFNWHDKGGIYPVRSFCKFKHSFSHSGDNFMRLYNKGANELDDI